MALYVIVDLFMFFDISCSFNKHAIIIRFYFSGVIALKVKQNVKTLFSLLSLSRKKMYFMLRYFIT